MVLRPRLESLPSPPGKILEHHAGISISGFFYFIFKHKLSKCLNEFFKRKNC